MMKAWRLNDIGDIKLTDIDIPVPKLGEVRIKVMSAGVCGSDIPRIYETGAHFMPLVPGHEFSGIVEGIGKDAPPLWLGKRVGVFPLIPCGKCEPCRYGHPEMCRDYGYIGSRRDGAFAEYVTVPVSNLIELPEKVTFEEAAMLEPMAVAVHAMRQAVELCGSYLSHDAKIIVCGVGTIGLLITMFLLEHGFRSIYVIGNKAGQKKRVMDLGIPEDHWCDNSEVDAQEWITDTVGAADAFFECVGKKECVKLGIEVASPGGRLLLVGNPHSDMPLFKDTYWKILRNQLTLKGTWNSTFLNGDFSEDNPDDWHYCLSRLSEGKIHPDRLITHRLEIDEMDKGFSIMRNKAEDYCKIMMVH